MEDEHTGLIALGGGGLRNELRWQLKIEVAGAHGSIINLRRGIVHLQILCSSLGDNEVRAVNNL